jgi:hypothetical protein
MAELSETELKALVAEAIVDAYDEDEQLMGFAALIEDNILDLPLPQPPPGGAEWIGAYRHWAR